MSRVALIVLLTVMHGSWTAAAAAAVNPPCPVPKALQGKTADGACVAKGYKDQYGHPANPSVCKRLAVERKDAQTLFLIRYETSGCAQPGGCTAIQCKAVYKSSGLVLEND